MSIKIVKCFENWIVSLNSEPVSNLIEDISTQLAYLLVQIKSDYAELCLTREVIGLSCSIEDTCDLL